MPDTKSDDSTSKHASAPSPEAESDLQPRVRLEIVRHRQLFQLLREPKSIWRLLLTALCLIVVLFFGLSLVVLSIKKIYPYNTIETNLYGATVMGTEDKDVIYWLFNTAEMWANSGIEVQAGDVLTVRSSGSWHTAIHHLVEDTEENTQLSDRWTGSEGLPRTDRTSNFRAAFRVSDNNTDGVLLMSVFPADSIKRSADLRAASNSRFMARLDDVGYPNGKARIYEIGKERRDFKVTESGYLHFCVNDIMLTRSNTRHLYGAYLDSIASKIDTLLTPDQKACLRDWFNGWPCPRDLLQDETTTIQLPEALAALDSTLFRKDSIDSDFFKPFKFGRHPEDSRKFFRNELVYYYEQNFVDAWFVDNIGSLLVVIERKRNR